MDLLLAILLVVLFVLTTFVVLWFSEVATQAADRALEASKMCDAALKDANEIWEKIEARDKEEAG